LTEREKALLERVDQLEKRLAEVESMVKKPTAEAATTESSKIPAQTDLASAITPEVRPAAPPAPPPSSRFSKTGETLPFYKQSWENSARPEHTIWSFPVLPSSLSFGPL